MLFVTNKKIIFAFTLGNRGHLPHCKTVVCWNYDQTIKLNIVLNIYRVKKNCDILDKSCFFNDFFSINFSTVCERYQICMQFRQSAITAFAQVSPFKSSHPCQILVREILTKSSKRCLSIKSTYRHKINIDESCKKKKNWTYMLLVVVFFSWAINIPNVFYT